MFTTAVALVLVIPGNFSTIVNFLRQVRLSSRVGISWCLCVHAHIHSFTYLKVLCVCTLMHMCVYIYITSFWKPLCVTITYMHVCIHTYVHARFWKPELSHFSHSLPVVFPDFFLFI